MKTNFLLFTAIIILLSVFACNQSGNQMTGNQIASNETSAKKRIGVSLLTREDDFYRELETGLQEAARQNNFELLIQSGDKDLSKQQSQIDNFLVQKVDAIIVCPTDTQGIAPRLNAPMPRAFRFSPPTSRRAAAKSFRTSPRTMWRAGGSRRNTSSKRLTAKARSELSDSPKCNRSLTAKTVLKK
jgi:hypothetical protein